MAKLYPALHFQFLEEIPSVFISAYLSGRDSAFSIQTDALEETGDGSNQSHWLILLSMLSLVESQAVSNGLGLKQEAGIWISALRGAHILLWVRIAAT